MSKALTKFISDFTSEKEFDKRLVILSDFVNLYYDSNFSSVNSVLEKELENCRINKNLDAEALIRHLFTYSYFEKGDFARGQKEYALVMELFPSVKSHDIRAQIYNFEAFINSHQGNFEKAFHNAFACIKESELALDKKNRYWGTYTLGVLYFDLKDYVNAEKCYSQAAENFKLYGNDYGVARSETGLSSIYIQLEKYGEAERLLQRSLEFYKDEEILSGQSRSLNDLGAIFTKTQKYDAALDCFYRALEIRKETSHAQGIATTLNEISELLLIQKKYTEVEKYLAEAKEACEKINNKAKLYRTHLLFSQLYRNTDRPWKALEHYETYDALKTEVIGETANNKIKELQTRAATEKAEKEAEIERLRHVELKHAYDLIEEKNKEITDSIQYAKKIQYTLLANDELLNNNLADYFILFKPKDIVSGDFYWSAKKENKFYLAVCDSTGHGVPGAFMSLLNTSFLNEAIMEKNILAPNEVLNYVRDKLIENISKEDQQDGMDGALVCVEGNKITYAAAYNAPVLIRNKELIELEADKIPVGKGERSLSFRSFEFEMQKDDVLFVFTDGYADQFGGPRGKKFKYKQLQELLLKNYKLSMKEQKGILDEVLEQWKGDLEQVDDVLVVGLSVSQ